MDKIDVTTYLVLDRDHRSTWLSVVVNRHRNRKPKADEVRQGERVVKVTLRVPRAWWQGQRVIPFVTIDVPEPEEPEAATGQGEPYQPPEEPEERAEEPA